MSDLLGNYKSNLVGAISSLVVGLPTVGIFVPKVFYFLMELEASNYWVYLFLLLYLVSPLLLYWLAQKILMTDEPIKRIFPDKFSGPILIVLLVGFLAYCSTQTKQTFEDWADASELNEAINDTIHQRIRLSELNEVSKKIGIKPPTVRAEDKKFFMPDGTTYKLPHTEKPIYQYLQQYVQKKYEIQIEAYNQHIAQYLGYIQMLGIVLFLVIIVLLIIQIVNLRKEVSALNEDEDAEPLKLRMGIQEGILFTTVLLLFPLINPITAKLNKPSEVIQLANWDPTHYYNHTNKTSYQTYVTHYGVDNIFQVDSAKQVIPTAIGEGIVPTSSDSVGRRMDVGNAEKTFKVTLTNSHAEYLTHLRSISQSLKSISSSQNRFTQDFDRFVEGLIESQRIGDVRKKPDPEAP